MPVQSRDLADDEVVTQFGCTEEISKIEPPFRRRPRFDLPEMGISLILGRLSPAEAAYYVRTRRQPTPRDGVRYSTVATLREHGFVVDHTPSQRNPSHLTVSFPGPWDDEEDTMFDSCFTDPVWISEGGEDS